MIKRGYSALGLLMLCLMTWAIPAKRVKTTITLPDGTQKEVTLRGDERLHFYESEEGETFRGDEERGYVRAEREELMDVWEVRMQHDRERLSRRQARRKAKWGAEQNPVSGSKKGLVLLVNYSDKKMNTQHDNTFFTRYFNEEGFADEGMCGSVHDYFKSCSYGKFDLTFDVVGPLTLSKPMTYYGQNDEVGDDMHAAEMICEAVMLADKQGVDFSRYDWDSDGKVDQVFVMYAGYSEAQGAPSNTIWPHESELSEMAKYGDGSGAMTLDGVTLDTYACSSELRGISGTSVDGIGTACHEFSHCMCIPDMYDINGTNYGMDIWDLMDYGSYLDADGPNFGLCPAGYTSYERMYCGWLTPTEIDKYTEVAELRSLDKYPDAYIIYNKANRNEYYLLENRQKEGYFRGGYAHGMLVLHVFFDSGYWADNIVNTTSSKYTDNKYQRLTIVPANNRKPISSSMPASNYTGQTFPGTGKVTQLTNTTKPQASLYVPNTDGNKLLNMPITNIQENTVAKTISFVAGTKPSAIHAAEPERERAGKGAFDLQGRPAGERRTHGIYIINGKKTVL